VLDADTMPVKRLPLCDVLLMNDARYPWLILVPRRPSVSEIIDLSPDDRGRLMDEIALASTALKGAFDPDKLNVAALGNRVRQLHVHIIARFVSDVAWPGPVWGVGEAAPYPPHMAGMLIDRLEAALSDDQGRP
jgi:diadenosine tetraphosphate (Ap4A) HIT family hydrolase